MTLNMMVFSNPWGGIHDADIKICFLGETGVGKTALINSLLNGGFRERYWTTFSNKLAGMTTYFPNAFRLALVQLWDTSAHDKYLSQRRHFYKDMHCCILVFDVNSAKSLGALDKYLVQSRPEDPETIPYVLVGNKIDEDGGRNREVYEADARRWCQSRGDVHYYETSAIYGFNVDAALLDAIMTAWDTLFKQLLRDPTIVVRGRETSAISGFPRGAAGGEISGTKSDESQGSC